AQRHPPPPAGPRLRLCAGAVRAQRLAGGGRQRVADGARVGRADAAEGGRMSELRTPMKRAVGLGSAKRGVHHFLVQRVTAIALALLCGWAVWIAITLAGLDHAAAHALVARPLHAVLAIVFAI